MRSAIDSRHQPNDVLDPGTPGSVAHDHGAGVVQPQNKAASTNAGKGDGGRGVGLHAAPGGPVSHPQNLVAASDAGTGAGKSASGAKGGPGEQPQNQRTSSPGRAGTASTSHELGGEKAVQKNSAAGPRAIGPPLEKIPHAGQGNDGKGVGLKAAAGGPVSHPQNLVATSGAGTGGGGRGGAGGGGRGTEGHPQNKVLPVRRGARTKAVAKRTSASPNLKALSRL